MNPEERESRFLENVRSGLDSETQNLDLNTTTRLQRIRYSALEELESSPGRWRKLFRLPVLAVATGIIIVFVTTMTLKSPATLKDAQALTDLDILASEETLDMFADMEFYFWLAETDDHAG